MTEREVSRTADITGDPPALATAGVTLYARFLIVFQMDRSRWSHLRRRTLRRV